MCSGTYGYVMCATGGYDTCVCHGDICVMEEGGFDTLRPVLPCVVQTTCLHRFLRPGMKDLTELHLTHELSKLVYKP